MIVVRGKDAQEVGADELRRLVDAHAGVTVDLGTGDGRFAYRYAQAHPERLVIGVDPVRDNLREMSARAARKPERGGLANVLYVAASVEQLPPELGAIADEIFVLLPWGSLMRGIILGEERVLRAIAGLGRTGARVRMVLNTRIFDDPVPIQAQDLPDLTPDYVHATLSPAFDRVGMRIERADWMSPDEVARLETTWAKRLSHRAPPRSFEVVAVVG